MVAATIERMGQAARWSGLTTVTELGTAALGSDDVVERWLAAVDRPDFPVRVSAFYNPNFDASRGAIRDRVERVLALRARSSDKLRLGHVKMILDGSIQGFTARLNFPGYLGDRKNGIWLLTPEAFRENLEAFHRAGITVHVHCNGDQAVDPFIDSIFFDAVSAAKDFQVVLNAELQTFAAYQVSQKGIYSTPDLIDHAENAFDEQTRMALSDQVRVDFNQAC